MRANLTVEWNRPKLEPIYVPFEPLSGDLFSRFNCTFKPTIFDNLFSHWVTTVCVPKFGDAVPQFEDHCTGGGGRDRWSKGVSSSSR